MNTEKTNNELKPEMVFKYFGEITQVPRPSKHEERIIEFLCQFAKDHSFECKTDEAGNVLISKPATPGMETCPVTVLQAHMDMVCEKTADREIDFLNDPIETYIDGEWMRARGTTLGADDGIGIAIAMAVLTDEEIKHGPIECLFTRDEETGLTGAFAIQPGFMSGKYLINLDSEDEGEIFVGCAGGVGTTATFHYEPTAVPAGQFAMSVSINGLTGGHSGDDINKGRANANKLLVRFLYQSMKKYDLHLVCMDGGNLHNAIPRDAKAIITVPFADKENIRVDFNMYAAEAEAEYHNTDPNMKFTMQSEQLADDAACVDSKTACQLITSLQALHNGVLEYSQDIPGLVETSSNLASVKMTADNTITIVTSQRSSTLSQRNCMADTISATFTLAGAEVESGDGYPGWKPNPNSELLKIAIETYKQLFGKEPKVRAIHAGLECGLFSEKYPGMDMISFGPTLRGVHSPDERLHIPTVAMVWNHIVAILEKIG